MKRPRYIVVEGPIGVGKSTLTRLLSQRLDARTVFEVVEENPFLPLFYRDREKHAFQTQIFFLLSRFKQQQSLFQQDLFNQVTVSDYLFAKDRIFASLTLSPAELALYDRVFEELTPRVMKPDLVIYLQASLDVLLGRIKKRAREFESDFDADYLAQLCVAYNEYFARYNETPLLIANTDRVNFVTEAAEVVNLLEMIGDHDEGVRHYVSANERVSA
jgi:deoxyadenosine/deoxycytidine kinase